jgi:hypothetical protein
MHRLFHFNSSLFCTYFLKIRACQVLAHSCNSSYSGGRDQEDLHSEPAWANSLQNPILKNPTQKMIGGVAQSEGSGFKL